MIDSTRRRLLLSAAAASAGTLVHAGIAFAQGTPALLRAPKHALVIGNSRYRQTPLRNPVNDANGMAEALKSTGFDVTLAVDTSQAQMREAIRIYAETLVKRRAVGVFYFAGHGVQLAWRNYLIPVDAEIENMGQVGERAVDLNSLIDAIRQAGNPMNIIILDACRDNPFGTQTNIEQRGLSQLDAPPGTLLAYSTAPGNTAADGDGANGLYTENLLREIKVPEAKVEDVFKRVRLAVRRRSNGKQVPWESTSLEEDFWFIPPRELRRLAEAEAGREFRAELALWERIQSSPEPGPFEDYLQRYPSGRFSEVAQLRLDRILAGQGEKKVEVVSAPENPYSKGTARANTDLRVGDWFRYRVTDQFTKLERETFTLTVTAITGNEVVFNDGGHVTDLLGNPVRGRGRAFTQAQIIAPENSVGKRWTTRFRVRDLNGTAWTDTEYNLKVAAREKITIGAGTFDAFRVEGSGFNIQSGGQLDLVNWATPEVKRVVVHQLTRRNRAGAVVDSYREELVAYQQA